MRKTSFTQKMIRYNLLLFAGMLLVVSLAFYIWVVQDAVQRTETDFETLASKTGNQFNTLVYNTDKTALQIAANPTIVNAFATLPKKTRSNYFVDNPVIAAEIIRLLNSYNFKKDGNTRICLYNDVGDYVYSVTVMTTVEGMEQFFASGDFQAIRQHFEGNNVFSMFRISTEDLMNTSGLPSPHYFSIVRQIKDYYTGTQKNGYVEVQQSVARMDDIFKNLGEGCCAALFDASGRIVYKSPTSKGNAEAHERLCSIEAASLQSGLNKRDGDLCFRFDVEEAPVRVVFFKQSSTTLASISQFNVVLILTMLTAFVAAIVSELLVARRLSKPLVELSRSMKHVTLDNLHMELASTDSSDELQHLDMAFNKMLSHLDRAINRQLISQTNELKAQLMALQSQMNPHFIYNILGIINMEAELTDNEKITTICRALSHMLEYTSSMQNGFATMEAELVHTGNYLELMKQRYEESFEYQIDIEDSLKGVQVLKLLVQPICENCFKHGFVNCEGVKRINVTASRKSDEWTICVEDNGCGISDEALASFEAFKASLTPINLRQKMNETTIGGLAITNICLRLRLCYGEHYRFEMENTGHGTKVTLGGEINGSDCHRGG